MRTPNFLLPAVFLATTVSVALSEPSERASQNKELEKSMIRIHAQVQIDAPVAEVWPVVGKNFDQSAKFNVDAKETRYLKKTNQILGSQRRTTNAKGKVIDVEVVNYDPEAKFIKWEIYNQNVAPLDAGYSSYTLKSDGEGGTLLTQEAAFKMKYKIMHLVARRKMSPIFKTELSAIKHLVETGESITPTTKNEIVKRYHKAVRILDE
jgi:hypothetical protein